MIDTITSRTNKKIQMAISLRNKKDQFDNNLFLMEGYKSLLMAIDSNCLVEVFTLKEIKEVNDDIPQHLINESVLDKLSITKNPEGIVFIAKMPKFNKEINKAIYLDGISDPGNMGTIIRSAIAFNYDAIYISSDCVSPYNSKALASSKGSIFKIPVIVSDLKSLKSKYQLVGTIIDKSATDISNLKVNDKHILVFGNEANGIRKENINLLDVKSYIPINNVESLNVSIASSIYMFMMSKK